MQWKVKNSLALVMNCALREIKSPSLVSTPKQNLENLVINVVTDRSESLILFF